MSTRAADLDDIRFERDASVLLRAASEKPTIRLLCGDSRELLPISADVVITDPPYGIDSRGRMLGQLASNYHEKGTHTRGYADHKPHLYRELMLPVFDGMHASLPKGGLAVVFGGNRTFHELGTHAAAAGFEILDIIVFAGGSSFAKAKSMLMPRHEVAYFMRKRGPVQHINPLRNIPNLHRLAKTRVASDHDTPKPDPWMTMLIEVFTQRGQTVLDPFAGSGSTLIAAHDLGRSAVGIEVDAAAVDDARRRLGNRLHEPIAA